MSLLDKLNVKLKESLDVILCKGNGHGDGVLVSLLAPTLDRIASLRTQPGTWANLTLPSDSVRVGPAELLHDSGNSSCDFGRVGITATRDDLHGQRVCTEHDGHGRADVFWVRLEYVLNALGE